MKPQTESAEFTRAAPPWVAPCQAVVVLLFGFGVRAWLIERYPAIFGGDTIVRLVNRDHILLAYQLPLLQAALHALSRISDDAMLARYLMAAIGGLAGAGFYLLVSDFAGPSAAFSAALLFASNPFLVAYSIVPYQEILMLAGLLFAFHFFFRGRVVAASLCLGAACLTRYEAWAACPVLALAYASRQAWRPSSAIKAVVLFGWAPLGWLAYNQGLAPSGTFVVESAITPARLVRYVYLGWITVKNAPAPVLLVAALGAWEFWRRQWFRDHRVRLLAGFFGLFLITLLFSAHGVSPDPERFVTAREAHLIIAAVIGLAGFALVHSSRLRLLLVIAGIVWGVYAANRFVARDTSDPRLQLSYRLARYLDANVHGDEKATVFARPIPQELIQDYLNRATRRGGAAGLEQAQRVLASVDTSPIDYQRTLAHSRLGRARLLSFGRPASGTAARPPDSAVKWVAVWSDFDPSDPAESKLLASLTVGAIPVEVLREGSVSVAVYRVANTGPGR